MSSHGSAHRRIPKKAALSFGTWRNLLRKLAQGVNKQNKERIYEEQKHHIWCFGCLIGWQPDPALAAFLEAGPPPVYFGFGSMPGLDPETMTGMILDALEMTGKRGLLAVGSGAIGLEKMSDRAFFLKNAPHDVLLPRASAAVHHGGAGTTAASLRAGLPTQIIPFFGDQPFWGRRVAALGAGPAPLNRRTLSASILANALVAMDVPTMRSRAKALGAAIESDRGIEMAIEFLEGASRRTKS